MDKQLHKHGVDLVLWSLAVPAAFALRLEGELGTYLHSMIALGFAGLPLKSALLLVGGTHRAAWRSTGLADLLRVVGVVFFEATCATAFVLAFPWLRVPRSVPIIAAMLATMAMCSARIALRLWSERRTARALTLGPRSVVIAGAGEAGRLLIREIVRHPECGLVIAGAVDDDPAKVGSRVHGVPVLGPIDDLARVVRSVHADEVLLAIPSGGGELRRKVSVLAESAGVGLRMFPLVHELVSGKVTIDQLREVPLEELLRRDHVRFDQDAVSDCVEDKVVLIAGAGGSIGSELVRQLICFRPRRLLLLGRGEDSIYKIEQEIRARWPDVDRALLIADIRDRRRLESIFREHRPEIIFQAAAHKHVGLMEANPDEAILNNVEGTKNMLELALESGVERFVNISSDKAVSPTSVMGMTKRVTELLVYAAAQRAGAGQSFITVRFGNVLGSRGSVVPIFRRQIARGGPVTVTDLEMTRYFMTIPEAAQLVLSATTLGENSGIYVLDMGDPVRIYDLAVDVIRLSGLEPHLDIKIEITGATAGEKLHEELCGPGETLIPSAGHKVLQASFEPMNADAIERRAAKLIESARRDGNAARASLVELTNADFRRRQPVMDRAARGRKEARVS